MKRAYEITLNGTVYRLRLTTRAQKKLIKAYGQQAAQVCVDGFADLDKLCSVLTALPTMLYSFVVNTDWGALASGIFTAITEPKPYSEREKRTDYPKNLSFRDGICEAIDAILRQKPEDFDTFLRMLEEYGYEVKRSKNIALKGKGQQRFIRLRSLGEGYSEEEIRAVIAGASEHQPRRHRKEKQFSAAPPKIQLLIDIEVKRAQGKGGGYICRAKSFNLQQMTEAVCFIKERDIGTYDELVEKTDAATARFNELSDSIKSAEQRLAEIAALKKHIINYSRTKETYAAYKKSGYSTKFLEEHREEITLHKAAKAAFNELDGTDGQGKGKVKEPLNKWTRADCEEICVRKRRKRAGSGAPQGAGIPLEGNPDGFQAIATHLWRKFTARRQSSFVQRFLKIPTIRQLNQEQEEQRRQQKQQHNTDRQRGTGRPSQKIAMACRAFFCRLVLLAFWISFALPLFYRNQANASYFC